MKMIIYNLKNGDKVYRFDRNITIPFQGKRKVLGTSPHKGGYREDIKTIFNHDGCCGLGVPCKMKGDTYREHMLNTIEEIGLDPETTTGMETAAHMENVSIKEKSYENLTVTAIVTGGIEVNGGRVGDPSSFVEKSDVAQEYRIGTINIILYIDADMSPGGMARALVTCSEAKTVAIQELQLGSQYSRGIATGSGTDSTIVVADAESPRYLTNAGKHSKLGELIGITVKEAVKEALYLQGKVNSEYQYNAINRLRRFGLLEREVYHKYSEENEEKHLDRSKFSTRLNEISRSREGVILSSIVATLIDEMDWDLISIEDLTVSIKNIFEGYAKNKNIEFEITFSQTQDKDKVVKEVMDSWKILMAKEILSSMERLI